MKLKKRRKKKKKGEQRKKLIMGRDRYLPLLLQNLLTTCDQPLNMIKLPCNISLFLFLKLLFLSSAITGLLISPLFCRHPSLLFIFNSIVTTRNEGEFEPS